jgi:hypothetical protein
MFENLDYKVKVKILKYDINMKLIDEICFNYNSLKHGLLTNSGKDFLVKALRGDSLTFFNNANTYLGVGDDDTAATVLQTDLIAATNKYRKNADIGFPKIIGDSGGPTNYGEILYSFTFLTSEANFEWKEFGFFNDATSGIMFDRFVNNSGIKNNEQIWAIELTFIFA